ncbi:MAG: FtsX-like permease family protein [Bacteroidota bacterium]
MRAILSLSVKQLQRRKGQYALLAASILLGTSLLAAGLGMLWGLHRPFEKVFEQLEGGHFLLYMDQRANDIPAIRQWFAAQEEVASVSRERSFVMQNGPFLLSGQKFEQQLRISEYRFFEGEPDPLKKVAGNSQSQPAMGEIWLPAYLMQNHQIEIGDSLGIPTAAGVWWLEVSGGVIDPHFASGMVNPSIAWVGAGSLVGAYSLQELQQIHLSIRLHDPAMMAAVWDRFVETFSYQGSKMDYELFRAAFGSVFGLMASALLLVSLLSFGLAMLLIRNSLIANIQADYRQIGILKSMGFLPKAITQAYLWQTMSIALLGVLLGLGLGRTLLPLLMQSATQNLGLLQLNIPLLPFLLAGGFSLTMIGIIAWLSSRQASQIPAATAIRYGRPPVKTTLRVFAFRGLRQAKLYFAGHLAQSRPIRLLSMLAATTACMAIMSSLLNLGHSFEGLSTQPEAWGFEAVDLTLKKSDQVLISRRHKEIMAMFEQEPDIKQVIPFQWYNLEILAQNGAPSRSLIGKVYSESFRAAGLLNLEGKHPQADDEISLCVGTARQYGLTLGDLVNIKLEGQEMSFKLSGIYQDIGNMGQGFRLHASSLLELNPLFEPSFYGLQLRPDSDVEFVKTYLGQSYGEMFKPERSIAEIVASMGVVQGIWGLVQLLSLFFLCVLAIMIVFDQGMSLREEREHVKSLQAIGMLRQQLRLSFTIRTALWLIGGIVLGISLGMLLGGQLISLVSGGLGLPDFPYRPSISLNLAIALFTLLLGLGLSTAYCYRKLPSLHS